MEFCDKIKFVREKLKLSQESLARELQVSFATINRLELGKSLPSYKTLQEFERFCKQNNIIIRDGEKND